MPYCPKCGSPVNIGDRFCANCGMGLHTVTPPTTVTPSVAVNNSGVRSDYRLILVSRGSCSRAAAVDMLSDLLGYTDADAARIIDNAPMEIALGLTAIQAQYISQAITEYGMQVAIYNSDGYVDMGSKATTSVYDNDGSFLSAVAGVLMGLTVGNRVTSFNRWTRPTPTVFRTGYRRATPLTTYRRRRPAPIPVVRHAAPPIPRPTPAPRPKPVPARSVEGSRPLPVTPVPRPAPQRPAPTGPVTTPRPAGPHSNGPHGGTGRGGQGGPMGGPGGGRRG